MKAAILQKVLKNGMTILLEKRDCRFFLLHLLLGAEELMNNFLKKELSHLLNILLYKGTPTRNSKQIAEEIEKKGR
jgi:predicted Zn-dependent peptidase